MFRKIGTIVLGGGLLALLFAISAVSQGPLTFQGKPTVAQIEPYLAQAVPGFGWNGQGHFGSGESEDWIFTVSPAFNNTALPVPNGLPNPPVIGFPPTGAPPPFCTGASCRVDDPVPPDDIPEIAANRKKDKEKCNAGRGNSDEATQEELEEQQAIIEAGGEIDSKCVLGDPGNSALVNSGGDESGFSTQEPGNSGNNNNNGNNSNNGNNNSNNDNNNNNNNNGNNNNSGNNGNNNNNSNNSNNNNGNNGNNENNGNSGNNNSCNNPGNNPNCPPPPTPSSFTPQFDFGDAPEFDPDNEEQADLVLFETGDIQPLFPTAVNGADDTWFVSHSAPLEQVFLGELASVEAQAEQVDLDDDDAFADPDQLNLAPCLTQAVQIFVTLPFSFDPEAGTELYLNALFDWNADGEWDGETGRDTCFFDVPEWAIQNLRLDQEPYNLSEPGIYLVTVPLTAGGQAGDIWSRFTVTTVPINEATVSPTE